MNLGRSEDVFLIYKEEKKEVCCQINAVLVEAKAERVYFGLWFQVEYVHLGRQGTIGMVW